jgi:hypothetical protein
VRAASSPLGPHNRDQMPGWRLALFAVIGLAMWGGLARVVVEVWSWLHP